MPDLCLRANCSRRAVRYAIACHDHWLRLSADERTWFRATYDATRGRRAYLWQAWRERRAMRIQPKPVTRND